MFLAAGIFFAETFQTEAGAYGLLTMLLLLVASGFLLKNHMYGIRWVFGACASCFMFLLGIVLTEHAWREVRADWLPEKHAYRGVLQETVQEKPRTYQCRVEVSGKDVYLYLPKDSLSSSLTIGEEVLFYAQIAPPQNRTEVLDFDYATYLYHKGISGTAYVPADAWEKTGIVRAKTWKQEALLFRERMLDKYRQWGIGVEQMPILSALTLGYKGELDKETREAYSKAGISHVLALSGMHIGIVWILLNAMLSLLIPRRLKWLKWLLVTLVLWGFAFVVGLEASVVRAVVMCMLMGLGGLAGARPLSINNLYLAAFFMLLYHPFYLFDVSFQLSFVAVASILLAYPLIFESLPIRNRPLRWLWGITAVSIAAQLGTSPLVMYYFSNFSVYFLLSNILAAVLVPLIIYVCVLMVIVSPFPVVQLWVVKCLNMMVEWLNGVANWTGSLPFSSFSFPVLHPLEVALSYVFLLVALKYWEIRKRQWLIALLASLACLLMARLLMLLSM